MIRIIQVDILQADLMMIAMRDTIKPTKVIGMLSNQYRAAVKAAWATELIAQGYSLTQACCSSKKLKNEAAQSTHSVSRMATDQGSSTDGRYRDSQLSRKLLSSYSINYKINRRSNLITEFIEKDKCQPVLYKCYQNID